VDSEDKIELKVQKKIDIKSLSESDALTFNNTSAREICFLENV